MLASLFFVSAHKDSATRHGCALRSACRGALVACGDRPAPTEAAAETKSFCPCHKTGRNSGFLPVFFLHVLHGFGVHLGSDTGFSHPASSVSNRCHPLQHPKRTRFRLFRAVPGAFFSFSLLSGRKIFALVFVQPAHSAYKLMPSVIPCRREVSFFT